MGLFGKLFEKKICDLCGEEIGLFGNRKLEDGNCCKACAAKLSPWFSDRKNSTVEEIRQQLAYREENKQAVEAFEVTRSYGNRTMVLLDDNAGNFIVTKAKDFREANADVLSFRQVTGCDLEIKEARNEVYRQVKDAEGKTHNESYSPERYRYSYCFEMTIRVNHPFFDTMNFQLSDGYFEVKAFGRVRSSLFGFTTLTESGSSGEGSVDPPTLEDRRENEKYARYEQMAQEIRQALMAPRPENPEPQPAVRPDISQYISCPWCGAPAIPGSKFCEHCGGKLDS